MPRALLLLVSGALVGGAAAYVSGRLGTQNETYVAAARNDSSTRLAASLESAGSLGNGEGSSNDAAAASPGSDLDPPLDSALDPAPDPMLERAAADPEAVLGELPDLFPPARQREVALALLDALGNDDAALSRVAAMLPEANRLSFRIDALAARAESDLASALQSALALDVTEARRLAMARIAEAAAGLDPSRSLAQASLIGDRDLRALYIRSAASAWAAADAGAALAYLEAAVPSELPASAAAGALDAIASSDHELLLASLDSLSPALQPAARRAAILALAERDPAAAVARVESLGPGRDLTELEAAVAERYALEDPAAAVAWAKTRANSQSALEGALRGAAAADYDAAVDLAMQVLETEDIWPTFALVESGDGDFNQFADRLLASSVPELEQKFQALMIRWPQIDAEAALRWAETNAGRLERGWLERLTLDGAREYPELAMAMLDRVPADLRGDFIAGVAGGIGSTDVDRALAFLERHRGQPGYEAGLARVVDSLTASDPVAAARLVDRTGARAAGRVGWAWAQHDPVAASSWVASLEDSGMRTDGVLNLAGNWSRVDPDATIEWLLELPSDRARDLGLSTSVQTAMAVTGTLEVRALNAIEDDQIRERAALGAIVVLSRRDPDAARRLIDDHVEDPRLRQQALQQIAEQGGGVDFVSVFSSSIDVPR